MGEENTVSVGRWAGKRALSTPTAAVIMIVVILVVGGIGYVALNSKGTTSTTRVSCVPAGSAACEAGIAGHDLTLSAPFQSVQQGAVVPFTASAPPGSVVSSWAFNFGDGSNQTSTTPSASHAYATSGNYIASVTAVIKGATHDSYRDLVPISVTPSYASGSSGNTPSVTGIITTNSTPVTGVTPTAVIQTGGSVTLQGTYTSAPTNPLFSVLAPTWVTPTGGTVSGVTTSNSTSAGTFTFASAGTYSVTFVGSAASSGSPTAYQNYSWTVFVATTGFHAGASAASTAKSPHPGSIIAYELAPGGSLSEDPAIDYETLGYEPIINVYQNLIAYNGSQTGPTFSSYIPEIATCVPGSDVGANNCQSMYDSTLISGSNYTFVISSAPQFYDPNNPNTATNHWGVYPTDVVFSLIRTMGFATLPCVECNNGWIVTQALLGPGNGTWDAIHGALNNTPEQMWNSMTINESGLCPAIAMTADHGCVTFHADGGGLNWPYFLELIADPLGSAIVPAGWFSAPAQAAGIPYWTAGNVTGTGDHPVPVPGSPGYGVAWNTLNPTALDQYETAASGPPYIGNVQWGMAGSGPYYMKNIKPTLSYDLQANPSYASNPLCTWTGCQPAVGAYASSVSVTWETTQVPGEQAYAAGVADFASIPSTDTAFLLQLIAQGKITATAFPSISIDFFPFNLDFDLTAARTYTSNPITTPTDWFSYLGMRQFFAAAYPYSTIQQTINTIGGIPYDFQYGGAIPQFMANYYPTNVSWPTGNPDTVATDVGGAAWWWAQLTTKGSAYYDPEAAACSAANPCQLPLFGQTGAPPLDQRIALWVAEISSLTGGAVIANPLDINFIDAVINSLYTGPYGNPMPVYRLGWAPDYPDPTDYVNPLWRPDATYTASDVDSEQMSLPAFDNASCMPAADWTYWSNLAQTLKTGGGIPNDCQGAAYAAMNDALTAAATMPAGPQRVLTYAEAEQIANGLAMYVYSFQDNEVVTSAAWVNVTSFNSNVCIGGGADSTWYTITGNGVAG
jgi:peptide/nickel transport system substrate-binding protein